MDHVLIARVLRRVRDNVDVLAAAVGSTGTGTVDDLCDIAVARQLTNGLLGAGATPTELADAGEVLLRASELMTYHRHAIDLEPTADRLLWAYAGLYLRLVALAFSEVADVAVWVEPGREVRRVRELAAVGVISLSTVVTPAAVDRLSHALERSLALASPIQDFESPFHLQSAALVERLNDD